MSIGKNAFRPPSSTVKLKKRYTNWHEAASCAIQIELRDYAQLLDFQSEYPLGKNSYRIDLLIIKKRNAQPIPKNIAHIFSSYNLIEIKGIGSSVNTDSYYKSIGYAGLLINQTGEQNQYTAADITLTFLSLHYPKKLFRHLKKERGLTIETFSSGIYYIFAETFRIQIIVTTQLSPEENLYLHCLTDNFTDVRLANRLADDYKKHRDQNVYVKYMHQLTTANLKKKGNTAMDSPLICEGLLNLFGTSSEEIIESTRERTQNEDAAYYLPQINYLKSLLEQNNIKFNLNSVISSTQK